MNPVQPVDAQNSYLSGLISVLPVNRRSKKDGVLHYDAVYKYRVLAMIDSLALSWVKYIAILMYNV